MSKPLLLLFLLKIALVVYMLSIFKQAVLIKEFGPYSGSVSIESVVSGGSTLTIPQFLKQISPRLTLIYFTLNIVMGIEVGLHYFERLEKKYVIFDSMGKYTLPGLLWRVYMFDLVYILTFSLLSGAIIGLPLHIYDLSGKWLLFGLASGALLFASWLAIFSLVIGFSRDRATGLLTYILISILLYFTGSFLGGKANLFDFTSFSAGITFSQYELFKAQIQVYPIEIMTLLLVVGIVSAALGVSRYEAK